MIRHSLIIPFGIIYSPVTALLSAAALTLSTYTGSVDLVVLPLSGYDVILGMPWLEEVNPTINWRQKSIAFHQRGHHHILQSDWSLHLLSNVELRRAIKKSQVHSIVVVRWSDTGDPAAARPSELLCSAARVDPIESESDADRARRHMLASYRDVFPEDLPPGLPPERDIDHRIELTRRTKLHDERRRRRRLRRESHR